MAPLVERLRVETKLLGYVYVASARAPSAAGELEP
jgi:hypothetical protein